MIYIKVTLLRTVSSVVERLPYKQRATGSSPVPSIQKHLIYDLDKHIGPIV